MTAPTVAVATAPQIPPRTSPSNALLVGSIEMPSGEKHWRGGAMSDHRQQLRGGDSDIIGLSAAPPNDQAQQRRGTGELWSPETNHAPPSGAAPGSASSLPPSYWLTEPESHSPLCGCHTRCRRETPLRSSWVPT